MKRILLLIGLLIIVGCTGFNDDKYCSFNYSDTSFVLVGIPNQTLRFNNANITDCCCVFGEKKTMICECKK